MDNFDPKDNVYNTVIIGSGPAGCTAAIYACRAGLNPVLIEGPESGGQLVITPEIANWPGEFEDPSGFDLMQKLQTHAKKQGTVFLSDSVVKASLKGDIKILTLSSGRELKAYTVIVCTGAKARYLGLASETQYKGAGVSACATCDGMFFRGKRVAVVGGGSAAFSEALFLTKMCAHVTLIHRRTTFKAEQVLIKEFEEKIASGKASYELNATVDEVLGDGDCVNGLRLKTADGCRVLDVAGLFVAIGHDPATSFLDELECDEQGYIRVGFGAETATSVAGVFSAGDCSDKVYRQAITSAGQGCKAALDCERYLTKL